MEIYVPLDRSEASKKIIPLASMIAEASNGSLCYVHATDEIKSAADLLDVLQLSKEQLRDAILQPLVGDPGRLISETASEHPDSLIVMPMTSFDSRPPDGLGPVSLQVLKNADRPIIFAPPEGNWETWKPRRMLLPQDSTAECAAAVGPAVAMASTYHAKLTLVHVPTYLDIPLTAAHEALPLPRFLDQPQHELPAWREEFIERLRSLANIPEDLELEVILGMGEPKDEILKWAAKTVSDLIVMPWYRNYDKAKVLRGVLGQATCPVMVLPVNREREREISAA